MTTQSFRCLERVTDLILLRAVKSEWPGLLVKFDRYFSEDGYDYSKASGAFELITCDMLYNNKLEFCKYVYENTKSQKGIDFLVDYCRDKGIRFQTAIVYADVASNQEASSRGAMKQKPVDTNIFSFDVQISIGRTSKSNLPAAYKIQGSFDDPDFSCFRATRNFYLNTKMFKFGGQVTAEQFDIFEGLIGTGLPLYISVLCDPKSDLRNRLFVLNISGTGVSLDVKSAESKSG
jgi:hypothetical protein